MILVRTFSFLLADYAPIEGASLDFRIIRKAGREAEGIVRADVADCPAGVHNHEIGGVARKRRTEPPNSGGTRAVVLVLDFAIPGGIIGVLRLFVLLVRVSVGKLPKTSYSERRKK